MDKRSNLQERGKQHKFQGGITLVWCSAPSHLLDQEKGGIKMNKYPYKNLVRTAVEWRHLAACCLPAASVRQEILALESTYRYPLL